MNIITRKCTKCGIEKTIDEFSKDNSKKKIPYRAVCKPCEKDNYTKYSVTEKYKKKAVERAKRYIEKNKEKCLAIKKLWNERNKDKINGYTKARQHRISKANSGISLAEWKELCNKYDNKCLCCGTDKNITLDHVFPISMGGGDTIINAQPLCGSCNSKKGSRYIDYRTK